MITRNFAYSFAYSPARRYTQDMRMMKPADMMVNGDVLDYTTPNGYYTVRLYRHPDNVGHVEIIRNVVGSTSVSYPAEPFGEAQERARSQSLFLKMVDLDIGK